MAEALTAGGHRVSVLTMRLSNLPLRERINGVQVVRFAFLPWGSLAPFTFMLCCLCYLLRHRRKIDLIHAHQHHCAFIAAAAKMFTGIPVIAHFHGGFHDAGSEVMMLCKGLKGKLMLEIVKRYTDACIVVSRALREDLLQAGIQGNIYVLPNGVDVVDFRPVDPLEKAGLRKRLDLPPDGVVFVFSGRLEPVKGVDLLTEAWGILADVLEGSILVVLGEGSLSGPVSRFGENAPTCIVRGPVTSVKDYLQAADAFIMPSRYEGTSLAVLEAMACALPVLVTRVGGNTEIIKNGKNGLLVPPEDVPALVHWMKRLSLDRKLRGELGKEARRTVLDRFSFTGMMNTYREICRHVARKASQS